MTGASGNKGGNEMTEKDRIESRSRHEPCKCPSCPEGWQHPSAERHGRLVCNICGTYDDAPQPTSYMPIQPCPFCGSPGHLHYSSDREIVNVRCVSWAPGMCMGAGQNCHDENKAIHAWNRRASRSETETAKLRSALEQIANMQRSAPSVPQDVVRMQRIAREALK